MDPEQALKDAEGYAAAGAYRLAREALTHYYGWRRRGGFEPHRGDARARAVEDRMTRK